MDVKSKPSGQTAIAKSSEPDFTDQLIEPFNHLKTEVDRIFDSFPFRLPTLRLGRFTATPVVEMTETAKAYKVRVELPGMDPEGIDVTLDDGVLRIAGEKHEGREEDERGYRVSERRYGAFERLIELPAAATDDGVKAKFRHGLLTVTVPKNENAKVKAKRISVVKEA